MFSFLRVPQPIVRPADFKLGKKAAIRDAVSFRLRDYLSLTALPTPPKAVDHEHMLSDWLMLGNDYYGDCVWAGAAHETMMWVKDGGKVAAFTEANVLSDYSAVTGFNPNDPNSDQGTDMQAAASYRRKTGVIDATGKRHQIAAYLAVTPGNYSELRQAVYLFENVGIGFQFPQNAMDQFNAGKPWTVKAGSPIVGGHYVPALGYDRNYIYVITWGRVQKMSWHFFSRYCDEAIVYLSAEMLQSDKSVEGFDFKQLSDDLAALQSKAIGV